MRILQYIRRIRMAEGGIVRSVVDMCSGLAAHGHQVRLITYDDADAPERWSDPESRVRAVQIDPPTLPGELFTRAGFRPIAELVDWADVIHLHAIWTPSNIQIASAARKRGKPYIASLHGMLDDWALSIKGAKKRLFLRLWSRRYLYNAAVVLCTSEVERDQSRKWIPRAKIEVLPLVVDLTDYETLLGPLPAREAFPTLFGGPPVVLYLGRLFMGKGIEALIEATALLKNRGVDMRLALAGGGDPSYESGLRDLAERRDVNDRVDFLGLVFGRTKISLYDAADLFCLISEHENFGLVIPEAMACSCPVLLGPGVQIHREVVDSGGGRVAEPTPEAVADAIADILGGEADREAMGRRAREWVFDTLGTSRVVRRYEEIYRAAMTA